MAVKARLALTVDVEFNITKRDAKIIYHEPFEHPLAAYALDILAMDGIEQYVDVKDLIVTDIFIKEDEDDKTF